MSVISTEIEFTLPIGYRDGDGNLHRSGVMRLATAGDEILPLKDHRVQANPAYLSIIVLSRVIVRLGSLDMVNTKVIEDLFSADFAYLQDLYNRINQVQSEDNVVAMRARITRENSPPCSARPDLRGDRVHRVSLPLVVQGHPGDGARGAPPLVRTDQPHQRHHEQRRAREESSIGDMKWLWDRVPRGSRRPAPTRSWRTTSASRWAASWWAASRRWTGCR